MWLLKLLNLVATEAIKELRMTVRRPIALFGLVAGPFLVMALFGIGFIGSARPLEAIIVIPETIDVPRDPGYYERLSGYGLVVLDVTSEPSGAIETLERGHTDLVIIAPDDPEENFFDNRRSILQVWYRQVDPTLAAYAELAAVRLADQINREIIRIAVAEGYDRVLALSEDGVVTLSPEVIAQPVGVTTLNVAPTAPGVVRFFGPAVFALIIQHLALTLGALAIVRERRSGFLEMLRLSPGTVTEMLLGKSVAFFLLTGIVALVLTWVLVDPIAIPFLGDPWLYFGIVAALILASLFAGLFIGALADSDLQAVHLALLTLLVSVFFGGFVVPITSFREEIRLVAEAMPARNAAVTLQDVMLYGGTEATWRIGVLVLSVPLLLVPTILLVRRRLVRP